MTKFYRKIDIARETGIARTTINGWIDDFRIFMPAVKRGQIEVFKPEILDVIARIKTLRDEGYLKDDIFRVLKDEGFPITVEEAAEELENALKAPAQSTNQRENLMQMFGMMTTAVNELANQKATLTEHDEHLTDLDESVNTLTKQTASQGEQLQKVTRQLEGLTNLDESMETLAKETVSQSEQLAEVKRQLEETMKQIAAAAEVARENEELKRRLESLEEKSKKPWFKRLFG